MKKTRQIKLFCVLSALCGSFVVLFSVNGSASVQQIGPDLYAYISDNDASANSTFLVSDRGILVVDTGLNAIEGHKLLAEIRKVSQAPVRLDRQHALSPRSPRRQQRGRPGSDHHQHGIHAFKDSKFHPGKLRQ
jgi:hypothetical protein